MSVSSVSAPLPYNYLDTNPKTAPTATGDAATGDNGNSDASTDASTAQAQAQPPLPPGQGTRVNQLV